MGTWGLRGAVEDGEAGNWGAEGADATDGWAAETDQGEPQRWQRVPGANLKREPCHVGQNTWHSASLSAGSVLIRSFCYDLKPRLKVGNKNIDRRDNLLRKDSLFTLFRQGKKGARASGDEWSANQTKVWWPQERSQKLKHKKKESGILDLPLAKTKWSDSGQLALAS